MLRSAFRKLLPAALIYAPIAAFALTYTPVAAAAESDAGKYVPEHTIEAVTRAYDLGAERIAETVVMTKDGRLAVLHDFFLDTTTDVAFKYHGRVRPDGRYYACDFTLSEIKNLRVVGRFNPITHEPVRAGHIDDGTVYAVPSLEELLSAVRDLNRDSGRGVGVRIELRNPAFFESEGLDIVTAAVDVMTVFGYNVRHSKGTLAIYEDAAAERSAEMGWKGGLVTAASLGSPMVLRAREILSAGLAAPKTL